MPATGDGFRKVSASEGVWDLSPHMSRPAAERGPQIQCPSIVGTDEALLPIFTTAIDLAHRGEFENGLNERLAASDLHKSPPPGVKAREELGVTKRRVCEVENLLLIKLLSADASRAVDRRTP